MDQADGAARAFVIGGNQPARRLETGANLRPLPQDRFAEGCRLAPNRFLAHPQAAQIILGQFVVEIFEIGDLFECHVNSFEQP